ncbi:unnamed protein product [Cladocopium goreaui]|uniref:Uncharacterized protein n=1 Tax=Cladocopium goreaui TaxID=2562237 RepID=A0A9P1DWB4_9DINO|nr:unnamed protein product [Cladocopium goreaui]
MSVEPRQRYAFSSKGAGCPGKVPREPQILELPAMSKMGNSSLQLRLLSWIPAWLKVRAAAGKARCHE